MVINALLIWLALSLAFAAGYAFRALMEGISPEGDIDDRLKDYSDEYEGIRKPAEQESRHPLNVPLFALALIPFVLLTACLPKIETVTVTEKPCELAPLEPKPSLPVVEYVEVGDLICLDAENEANALEREVMLREYGNYCTAVYEKSRVRCGEAE